jgi:hypothetical protein
LTDVVCDGAGSGTLAESVLILANFPARRQCRRSRQRHFKPPRLTVWLPAVATPPPGYYRSVRGRRQAVCYKLSELSPKRLFETYLIGLPRREEAVHDIKALYFSSPSSQGWQLLKSTFRLTYWSTNEAQLRWPAAAAEVFGLGQQRDDALRTNVGWRVVLALGVSVRVVRPGVETLLLCWQFRLSRHLSLRLYVSGQC